MSQWKIELLKKAGWRHHDKDFGSRSDLWKNKAGEIFETAKKGTVEAEPIDYNIKDGVVTIGTAVAKTAGGLVAIYIGVKAVELLATWLSGGALAWTLAL